MDLAKRTDFVLPGLKTPENQDDLNNAWILAYSRRYNPRRLESFFYAAWNIILMALISGTKGTNLAPQFSIYTTPPEKTRYAADSISAVTVAEPNAVDIIPDFVIAYLQAMPRLGNSQAMGPDSTWDKFRVDKLYIPIMVEAKQSPPRSLERDEIARFVSQLEKTMMKAQDQVNLQARIMFHSETYQQQAVILLACVGEWWTWRIYTKVEADLAKRFLFAKENKKDKVEYYIRDREEIDAAADDMNIKDANRFEEADKNKPTRHPDVDGWPVDKLWSKLILFGSPYSSQKLYLIHKWLAGFVKRPKSFIQPPKEEPKKE